MSSDPHLVKESVNFLKRLNPEADLTPGSTISMLSRVASNDGKKVELCYLFSEAGCRDCIVEYCPFNPNRKEG